ncbi:MAG: ribosome-associated translation inhibitor RaiA [Patulibacter minatonensis]
MRIDVKGRNTPVTDELRALVERRFRTVAAQLPEDTRLEVEVREERNPRVTDCMVVEARLKMAGRTICAHDSSHSMRHAIVLCSEELARQVKATREKRRHIREARIVARDMRGASATI